MATRRQSAGLWRVELRRCLQNQSTLGRCAAKSICGLNAPHDAGKAAMQQIADWLEKLGMSEYAERFVENGISVAALPHLTDQDLKDIGVLLGHRRVMLAAISRLASAAPATSQP